MKKPRAHTAFYTSMLAHKLFRLCDEANPDRVAVLRRQIAEWISQRAVASRTRRWSNK